MHPQSISNESTSRARARARTRTHKTNKSFPIKVSCGGSVSKKQKAGQVRWAAVTTSNAGRAVGHYHDRPLRPHSAVHRLYV